MRLRRRRDDAGIRVVVNNRRCHQYGICEAEAANVFRLTGDGRLSYDPRPAESERDRVRMAARCCPMHAITVAERNR